MQSSLLPLKFLLFALLSNLWVTTIMTLPKQDCADRVTNCPNLMNLNCEEPTLKKFCPKTCGFCQDGTEKSTDEAKNTILQGIQAVDNPEEILKDSYKNKTKPVGRHWPDQYHLAKEYVDTHLPKQWVYAPMALVENAEQIQRGINCSDIRTSLHKNTIEDGHRLSPEWVHESRYFGYCPVKYHYKRTLKYGDVSPEYIIEAKCKCDGAHCGAGYQCTELRTLMSIWHRSSHTGGYVHDIEPVSVGCACVLRPANLAHHLINPWEDGKKKEKLWLDNEKCGPKNLLPNGKPAECNPKSTTHPCCSRFGYCGLGDRWCACTGCTDYRKKHEYCGPYRSLYTDDDCVLLAETGEGNTVQECEDQCDRLWKCDAINHSPTGKCQLRDCGKWTEEPPYPSGNWKDGWLSFSSGKPYEMSTCHPPFGYFP